MEIKFSTHETRVKVTILHVTGSIDSSTAQEFQHQAEQAVQQGALHILLDMPGVTYISSAGLRAIHNIFNQLRTAHQDVDDDELRRKMSSGTYKSPYLKISSLAPRVREAFDLGGFDTYIETYPNINAALSSF